MYTGFLSVERVIAEVISPDGVAREIARERVCTRPTVSALVVNVKEDIVWLVRQLRLPIGGHQSGLVAGYVDDGETPLEAMVREIQEEMGLTVAPESLQLIAKFWSSPGWTDEFNYVYYCLVTETPDVSKHYGVEAEGEDIVLIPVALRDFLDPPDGLEFESAKTVVARLWLRGGAR
jgi:8-oxo-dGTP pyrophosphatase MutT (NUDIX family)